MLSDDQMVLWPWGQGPRCARCNRHVDGFYKYYDYATMTQVYIAFCHGEREEVRLDEQLLQEASITLGDAFVSPPALTDGT